MKFRENMFKEQEFVARISERSSMYVRLYGEIIPELKRGDYRPYMRTNHTLSRLYHDIKCRPCTLRGISC